MKKFASLVSSEHFCNLVDRRTEQAQSMQPPPVSLSLFITPGSQHTFNSMHRARGDPSRQFIGRASAAGAKRQSALFVLMGGGLKMYYPP